MAVFDSTLIPHLPRIRADKPLIVTTVSIWVILIFLFSVSHYIDAHRAGSDRPYTFFLTNWALGFLPWLFMMPMVYLYGARDVNKALLPSLVTALTATAIALPISGLFNGFVFGYINNINPFQLMSSWQVRFWLWDGLLLFFTYLAGRQMRPRPENAPSPQEREPAIAVRSTTGVEFIPVKEIQGATAQGNYIALLMEGREVLHRATMAGLTEKLSESGFVRVHRSHIVNPNQVMGAKARGDKIREVQLSNGSRIPVSDRYMDDAHRALSGRIVD